MAGGFVLSHFILDGPLFEDPLTSIFGLVTINLAVFALVMIALIAVKEGKKEARARRKALKAQRRGEKLTGAAESAVTERPGLPTTLNSAPQATRAAQSLAAAGHSKNYTRPSKK